MNPKKCVFGMKEVEFVGHILKVDGVHFSAEKRGKVFDFPLPRRQKQLKSFLGLMNYFRDHVENLSVLSVPLNDMTIPYKKNGTVVWTHWVWFFPVCPSCPILPGLNLSFHA